MPVGDRKMLNELWEYIKYWVGIEGLIFARIDLIFIVIAFIYGGKQQEEQEQKKGEK